MNNASRRILLVIGTSILLALAAWSCFKVFTLSRKHGEINKDYSLVNNIANGLLSVDKWRDNIITVVNHQIDTFKLTEGQADTLQAQIEKVLHSVISKAADSLLEKKQTSIGGKLKKVVANIVVDEDQLHQQVPAYARSIVKKVQEPGTKKQMKALVKSKLKEFGAATYDSSKSHGRKEVQKILKKYNATSVANFNKKAQAKTNQLKHTTYVYTYTVIGIILLFLLLWYLLRNQPTVHKAFFIISVILALEVLLTGLATPMMEIDARIKSLDFQLIGVEVSFEDQVIFFQSKSIIDVVTALIETGKFDSLFVGILILIFSIVFPISKLLSTGVYLVGGKKWKKHKLVEFFAFKSGKWSMADVNVIAIFMAYIGFKGILDNQLSSLNIDTDTLTSVSTNNTSLQPGYIIFIGFVLFGLVLAVILSKITHANKV